MRTFMLMNPADAPLQQLTDRLYIKRDDLLDPLIGGNKFRKLKYNMLHAKDQQKNHLLTFGGAYSNHILATARAAQLNGFGATGLIRGHAENGLSPVLSKVEELGMHLNFISRDDYLRRHDADYIAQIQSKYPDAYIIPEGGTNALALRGVSEIRDELPDDVDLIATAVGSGGTLAGLVRAYADRPDVTILGFSVLKGDDQLTQTIQGLLEAEGIAPLCPWRVITDHHFGGYAKAPDTLIHFITSFEEQYGIDLDYVYTGKMMYGLLEHLNSHTNINKAVALHTGGLYTAHIKHLHAV